MVDLQTALHTHHEAVESFLAAAGAVSSSRWSEPRLPRKWSPGQVVEHVTLAYEANRGVLHGRPAAMSAPRLLRPLIRRFGLEPVLRRGRFIPGSKSPKAFKPSAAPASPAVLLDRMRAAVGSFEADAAALGSTTVAHPFFGRISLVDFVRLQEIHTRHHREQLAPAQSPAG